MMKRILLWTCLFFLAGCGSQRKELVLIIAADGLGPGRAVCSQEELETSGISMLCKSAVRFTHAFTPSTMSAPALASVLTGRLPFQHGLRNNAQTLNGSIPSLAQEFLKRSFHTFLASGSPPILTKTGLGRGFEVFNDHLGGEAFFQRDLKQLWRLAEDEIFSWYGLKKKTFMVLYTSELSGNVEINPTLQQAGTLDTSEIALQNFDHSLFEIFKKLQKSELWEQSTIVLMGLNGESDKSEITYPLPLELKTSNVQIALFIKPPSRKRDLPLSWAVDANVSLTDVSRTLFEMHELKYQAPQNFSPQSLVSVIGIGKSAPILNRPILVESDWARWRMKSSTRYAIINGDYLYIHDRDPKLYNMLTDKMQVNNIYRGNSRPMWENRKLIDELKLTDWRPYKAELTASLNMPFSYWLKGESLTTSDVASVQRLLKEYNPTLLERVQQNGEYHQAPEESNSCLSTYVQLFPNPKACPDLAILSLILSKIDLEAEKHRVRFDILYRRHLLGSQILKYNMALGDIWDHPHRLSLIPTALDWIMARPENRTTRLRILKEVQLKDPAHELPQKE